MKAAVRKKEKRVQTLESRVGLKMKHMHLLKGLTLKKLASLAHCSESVLSRVENGSANPSIKTMHRVALALNIPVSGLFQGADDEDGDVVLRQGERPTVQAGHGKGHKLEALIPSRAGISCPVTSTTFSLAAAKASSRIRAKSSVVLDGELD
jgi:transcriptional regulator with XRE-family HTH domain